MNKCKIIAVANEKGGVGKTTTVVNTASSLAKLGYKVLVVDLDPQTHLTVSLGFTEPEKLDLTITDFIEEFVAGNEMDAELIRASVIKAKDIDLMPSSFKLKNYSYALKEITGGEYALAEILKHVEDDYDYILIDCMSSTGIYTVNALVVANSVLIPSQAHYLSSNGLQLILSNIVAVKKRLNPQLSINGILVTMAQQNTNLCKNIIKTLKEDYSGIVHIFDTVIPLSITVADAPSKGLTVVDYMADNIGAIAYNNFAKELIK